MLTKKKMAGGLLDLRCENGYYSEMQVKTQYLEGNERGQNGCSREPRVREKERKRG